MYRAFTLIEILVVTVLVAVIASFATRIIPSDGASAYDKLISADVVVNKLRQANQQARTMSCEIKVNAGNNVLSFLTRSNANNCNSNVVDYTKNVSFYNNEENYYTLPKPQNFIILDNAGSDFIIKPDGSVNNNDSNAKIKIQLENNIIIIWKSTGYVEIEKINGL